MLSSWIYEIADLFLKEEASAALMTLDGDVLQAKSNLPFEVTGFKNIADTALKYVNLLPGEILVTNDSYSTGSLLHRYSFVMPLTRPGATQPGLLLCVRREFAPGLSSSDKIDNEGLRFPPTPIFQNGQLNKPIIEAMSMHPLCPQGFSSWLEHTVEELSGLRKRWQLLEKSSKPTFTTAEIKKFLAFSRDFTTEKILEKTQGDGRAEIRLDSGELLKLHLEINNGLVRADFGGTTAGVKCHLPDLATFGACFEALASFYHLNGFKNSGSFSALQVIKPLGCFLNAKYPHSPHQGLQTGVMAVQMAMTLALHQIVKNQQPLLSCADLKMEMAFPEGPRWFSSWSARHCCESISIEALEARYPVEFLRLEKDHEKMHLALELRALGVCQIRWLTDFTKHGLSAPKGLTAPKPPQLEILTPEGEWTPLPSQGSSDLAPGTNLRLNLWARFE